MDNFFMAERARRMKELTDWARTQEHSGLWSRIRDKAVRDYGLSRKTASEYADLICGETEAQTIASSQ